MTILFFALIILGGALGAGARYALDTAIPPPANGFPRGIFAVNVVGAIGAGFAVALSSVVGPGWLSISLVGILGGFTTFSTMAVDSVSLWRRGKGSLATLNVCATFFASLLGVWVGTQIPLMPAVLAQTPHAIAATAEGIWSMVLVIISVIGFAGVALTSGW